MTGRRGFTLIEILVAVMLAGLIAGLALAPVAFTVRRVVDTQSEYTNISALSRTLNFIGRDIFSAMRLSPNVLKIVDHDAMGGNAEDVLMVMSNAPSMQNVSSGTIVYKLTKGGMLHGNVLPGLYRWIMPGVEPQDIDHEKLNPEEGQLVLPYVKEFSVEIPTNERKDDNRKEYSGPLPKGIYISIGRGEGDKIESVIAFP